MAGVNLNGRDPLMSLVWVCIGLLVTRLANNSSLMMMLLIMVMMMMLLAMAMTIYI